MPEKLSNILVGLSDARMVSLLFYVFFNIFIEYFSVFAHMTIKHLPFV